MTSQLAAAALSVWLMAGQADTAQTQNPSPQPAPSAEDVRRAIEQLGDDKFAVREKATQWLWRAGRAAEPALRQALAGTDDPEVAARVRFLLNKFKYGIYPDTPPEVVSLIEQFREGDAKNTSAKQAVLSQLLDMGEIGTLLALVNSERDEDQRRRWLNLLLRDTHKVIPPLLVEGKFGRAEQLLQLSAATNTTGMRNYAALLLLREDLDGKIPLVRKRLEQKAEKQDAKLLAYLLRAKGDLPGALDAARKTGERYLPELVLAEMGRWKEVAALHADDPSPGEKIEHLGFLAAYYRMSGDEANLNKTIESIKQHSRDESDDRRDCMEALLINSRFHDAVELAKKEDLNDAFRLLFRQGNVRQALDVYGIGPDTEDFSDWFKPGGDEDDFRRRFSQGVYLAKSLHRLGRKQAAVSLFNLLAQEGIKQGAESVFWLCEEERKLGRAATAFEHATAALQQLPTSTHRDGVRRLFAEGELAAFWWEYLRKQHAEQSPTESLARLRKLLTPAAENKPLPGELADLMDAAEKRSVALGVTERARWLAALGRTHQAYGDGRQARQLWEKSVNASFDLQIALKIADLLVKGKKWKEAAAWYRKAWEQRQTNAAALYLHGWALHNAGDKPQGEKFMKLAHLLPLGSESKRYELGDALQQRGLTEQANEQWKLIRRIGPFDSWEAHYAARELGNQASGKHDLAAAGLWERFMNSVLETSSGFIEVESYLSLPHLVHKARAKGLLAAGKVDEALKHLRLAQAALPGETQLALDLLPLLESAGAKPAADKLFHEIYTVNKTICRDFPQAASRHNNLAWLAARTGRRLDDALQHAQAATRIEPDNAAYLDTQAEVHFRRGEKTQAVALAKRCLKLQPDNKHFQEQLKRFEGGD